MSNFLFATQMIYFSMSPGPRLEWMMRLECKQLQLVGYDLIGLDFYLFVRFNETNMHLQSDVDVKLSSSWSSVWDIVDQLTCLSNCWMHTKRLCIYGKTFYISHHHHHHHHHFLKPLFLFYKDEIGSVFLMKCLQEKSKNQLKSSSLGLF